MKRALLLVSILVATIGFASKAYSINSSVVAYRSILTERFAPPPDTPDVGVSKIVYPTPMDTLLLNHPPYYITIRIKNYGNVAVDSFDVSHRIQPFTPIFETIYNQIDPGDSLDYQFLSPMLPSFGYFTLCVKTELQQDNNPANDEVCQTQISGGISVYENHKEKTSVNLYPNPFSKQTTLQVNSSTNTSSQLNIYSVNGQKIMNQQVEIHQGENQIEIDLDHQNPGLYFYTLEIEGQVFSGKLFLK